MPTNAPHAPSTSAPAWVESVRTDCAAALGVHPDELAGCPILGTIKNAESNGAIVYWGCLPARSTMRGMRFGKGVGA